MSLSNVGDWISVTVHSKAPAAQDIVTLELVSADAQPLPAFSAGSHIELELPNGLVRPYSLCNDPSERHRYQIGVLLDPATRGGSRSVHDDLSVGGTLRIRSPRNHFALTPDAPALLLAGGIGITPILCMAEHLSAAEAPFVLHYCTRSADRTAFLSRIRSAAYADRVRFHFDDGDTVQAFDAEAVLSNPGDPTHLYVCGPKGYMDAVIATARRLGWSDEKIHFEYFAGSAAPQASDGSFEVRLARSGRVLRIAADRTVVQALAEHGVEIPVSCEQGVCGTCITRVLGGIPEHRDLYFSDAEKAQNDQFTPCCSRALSPMLVLDL